jgi:fructosamine-3-kinase
VDLGYLRAHPQQLPAFLTHQRIRETPVGGGSTCALRRLTLDDGASVFAKSWPQGSVVPVPPDLLDAEAAGLRWLREAGAPVPEVLVALPDLLATDWIEPGEPDQGAAERFGRALAALHLAGADSFGAPWPGYVGWTPVDNTPSRAGWSRWYAEIRLAPLLARAATRGVLAAGDVTLVERLLSRIDGYAAPPEPPARLHGALSSAHVLWDASGRAWLVHPAAHGGHRETDLAALALRGDVPYLDRMLASYQDIHPLAEGWRDRLPLHQLFPLLIHAARGEPDSRAGLLVAAGAFV